MEISEFKEEITVLKKFFETYCDNKHIEKENLNKELFYKEDININLYLCEDCYKKINYSFLRLIECPHEKKPSCRKCLNPCYGKKEWKETARIMRYSGIQLGLTSINKKLKKLFTKKKNED